MPSGDHAGDLTPLGMRVIGQNAVKLESTTSSGMAIRTLYEELIHVPLIVRVPWASARVVEQRVSLVSLAATILELIDTRAARAPPITPS